MLDLLQTYLQIGVENGAEPSSSWAWLIATALIAAVILQRQSDD